MAEAKVDEERQWESEPYEEADRAWPGRGRHILAQFDHERVVVYQAFNEEIAAYACEHQKFEGCAAYNHDRMTWIKTNFLWMMFRCGWGSKPRQQHVLAIWLKRNAFERYLELARTKGSVKGFRCTVRLQWDPDHFPDTSRHPYRKAVQLGLKGVSSFASGEDIVCIQDISDFVHKQAKFAYDKTMKWPGLWVAKERVYMPRSAAALEALKVDEESESS